MAGGTPITNHDLRREGTPGGEEVQSRWGFQKVMAQTGDPNRAHLWSLVLNSRGIPHSLQKDGHGLVLLVPPGYERIAAQELASFDQENLGWPAVRPRDFADQPVTRRPWSIPLLALLAVMHLVTGPWSGGSRWFEAGAVVRSRILDGGEWWRLVTALTLHADDIHLLANLIIGGIMVHLLCRMVGTGFGWTLVFMSGALGNLMNILVRNGEHLSVGFSTAVFGAIGVLSGLRLTAAQGVRGLVLPMGAGFGLLASLSGNGERVDHGAHVMGLLAGFALGMLIAFLPGLKRRLPNLLLQGLSLFATAVVLLGCWWGGLNRFHP